MIPCLDSISEIRHILGVNRSRGATVGLVPTMGALHDGHLSLISKARVDNKIVVVSIFVNPMQFGPSEDLDGYPCDLQGDRALVESAGCDVIFAPSVSEMYPEGYATWVDVERLTSGLCGRSRPGHFRGVCTVVTKLFSICQPDRAYFGEKDAQQLTVIRRMTRDLNLPVEIVACSTVRECDGLAMSSRNTLLTREQRTQAPVLYRALETARGVVESGERRAKRLESVIRSVLAEADLAQVDYVEIVRASDLSSVDVIEGECLIAVAVRFGATRLIDNIIMSV